MFGLKTKLVVLIIIIIVILLGNLIFKLESPDNKVLSCNWSLDMKMKTFSGSLKEKYIDRSNHGKETLVISKKEMEHQITLTNEKNNIFEKLEIGDLIKKDKGSLQISVIRGKEELIYEMDYGCID